MTPQARKQLAQAWLRHCQSRHPDRRFRLVTPDERLERNTQTAAREIIGSLTGPEQTNALSNVGTTGANQHRVERGNE